MLTTILLDLDGTLLTMSQDDFIGSYFKLLTARLDLLGFKPRAVIDTLWKGTAAMVQNDGTRPNSARFWDRFAADFGLDATQIAEVRLQCDDFYGREFHEVGALNAPTGDAPARAVRTLKAKGYRVALATNPIFPAVALDTRLSWIGLKPSDFALCTHYGNIGYCKPNLEYYREVCRRLGVQPQQCMMVGNSIREDMCAATLGMETYLVTGYIEGEGDLTAFPHRGSIGDFADFVAAMPDINSDAARRE